MTEPHPAPRDADLQALGPLVHAWSDDHAASLDRWKQGDLLPCPSLTWATADTITGESAPTHVWKSPAPYAVVVSQTCDIAATGPGARHPFVQVSPVVEVTGMTSSKWQSLRAGEVWDRYGLDPQGLTGSWVADLRASVPVRKEVLLEHEPIPGFGDEPGAFRFAEHLANRVRRPALHEFLSEVVAGEVAKAVSSALKGPDSGWCDKLSEVCFLVIGNRLSPTAIRLLVLTDDDLSPQERKTWVSLSDSFEKRGKRLGIGVLKPKVMTMDHCSATLYRQAVPIKIPSLAQHRVLAQPQP